MSREPAPVRVRIDVLSLPGGTRARGAAIGDSLRAELARTFGDAQAQRQLRAFTAPMLDAGRMSIRPGERAAKLGTRIGSQVASGLLGATNPRGRR